MAPSSSVGQRQFLFFELWNHKAWETIIHFNFPVEAYPHLAYAQLETITAKYHFEHVHNSTGIHGMKNNQKLLPQFQEITYKRCSYPIYERSLSFLISLLNYCVNTESSGFQAKHIWKRKME